MSKDLEKYHAEIIDDTIDDIDEHLSKTFKSEASLIYYAKKRCLTLIN